MAANARDTWEPVETVGAAEHAPGPLQLVDAAARTAGVDVRRFQSEAGKRAILVAAEHLAGGPLTADGVPPAVRHVLFLDPVEAEAGTGLLEFVGEPAHSVRLAVAGTAAPAGLTADTGQVVVDTGPGPAVAFRLYRLGDGPRIAPGPRVGESPDVITQRSEWFGTRHSGPDDSVDG